MKTRGNWVKSKEHSKAIGGGGNQNSTLQSDMGILLDLLKT